MGYSYCNYHTIILGVDYMKTSPGIACIIAIVSICFNFMSCTQSPDGKYTLKSGDCQDYVILKNLSYGKYMVVLKGTSEIENEIVGDFFENIISAKVSKEPIFFVINDNKVIMLFNEKRCIFEKEK